MITDIQWHRSGIPQGYVPPPPVTKELVSPNCAGPQPSTIYVVFHYKTPLVTLPRGPWGGMLHPLYFIKGLVSQKSFRCQTLKHIYSCSLRWNASNDTGRGPKGPCSTPLYFIRGQIYQKPFRASPPYPYIFLFLRIITSQWHWLRVPRGHAPLPFYKRLYRRNLSAQHP